MRSLPTSLSFYAMSFLPVSLTFMLYHGYTPEEQLTLGLIEDGYLRIKAPADGPSEYDVFRRDIDFNYGAYRIISDGIGENGISSNVLTVICGKRTLEGSATFVDTSVGWEFDTIARVSTTGILNRLQRNVDQIAQEMGITLNDTTHSLGSSTSIIMN